MGQEPRVRGVELRQGLALVAALLLLGCPAPEPTPGPPAAPAAPAAEQAAEVEPTRPVEAARTPAPADTDEPAADPLPARVEPAPPAPGAAEELAQRPPAEPPPAPGEAASPEPDGGVYVGSKSCKKCHLAEHRSWATTGKSYALGLLAPGERADAKRAAGLDPTADYRSHARCLGCHVVGHGATGGFDPATHLAADPEQLGGVGCESCHGPGGGYLAEGLHDRGYKGAARAQRLPALLAAGFVPAPKEQDCRTCHDAERSPTYRPFDYEQRLKEPAGVHQRPGR